MPVRTLVAWTTAVLGVGLAGAVAWTTNGTPGQRTIMPAVAVAVAGFVALVLVLHTPAVGFLARTGALLYVGVALGVVVAHAPSASVEAAVRRDEDALRARLPDSVDVMVRVTDHLLYVVDPSVDMPGCYRHLYGPWWEYTAIDGPDCPIGFEAAPQG